MNIKDLKNKKVLVTGGTGMIGRFLVEHLLNYGAIVTVASLDEKVNYSSWVRFIRTDLTYKDSCEKICEYQDYVFQVAGIKASPEVSKKYPFTFMTKLLQMNINMLDAAVKAGVKRYLYTSSIGVYAPSSVFNEDDVWKTFPSENDKYAGWAKRMGELQIEALHIENDKIETRIVRPCNIYGPGDNFDENAMVIPSLIRKFNDKTKPVTIWGDGSEIRDFLYAKDAAKGMIDVFLSNEDRPVNLGSGTGVMIRQIVNDLSNIFKRKDVIYEISKKSGDKIRVMNTERAKSIGFSPETKLYDGLLQTVNWFKQKGTQNRRYNPFL